MTPEFKAALFDMDGTLLCSMRYWRFAALEYLLRHDIIPLPETLARMYTSSSRKLCYEIASQYQPDVSMREIIVELESYMHRHYLHDVHIKPRVDEYLKKLAAANIPMCVATGAPREFARDGLRRLGLIGNFRFVTDSYEFGIDKHEAEYFSLMADKLGVRADEMCVFEDALYSIRAAKAAGCPVIGVEDDTQAGSREEIMRLSDRYIRSYTELIEE